MKIKFLTDFRGRETGERYFMAGEVWECEPEQAELLIESGRAKAVAERKPKPAPIPEPEPEPTPAKQPRKRKGR